MTQVAQRGHLPGSTAASPLEVEQRLRGDSTRALVHTQGLSSLNEDLFAGHAGLRDALTAEVKARSDAEKALARAVRAQAQGARGGITPTRPTAVAAAGPGEFS